MNASSRATHNQNPPQRSLASALTPHSNSPLSHPTQFHIQQQQQQQQQQQALNAFTRGANIIDPAHIHLAAHSPLGIKTEPLMDPNEFTFQTDFEIGNSAGPINSEIGTTNDSNLTSHTTNIISPLSSSPLDAADYDNDDFTTRGSGSLNDSPYGTSPHIFGHGTTGTEDLFPPIGSHPIDMKGRHHHHPNPNYGIGPGFYSMSMPVHGTAGFTSAIDIRGGTPSSFGAFPSNGSFGMDDVLSLDDGDSGK